MELYRYHPSRIHIRSPDILVPVVQRLLRDCINLSRWSVYVVSVDSVS